MSQRVLFIPIHVASMVEMFPVAEQIAADGRFEPLFFVFFPLKAQQLDLLTQRGLRVIGPGLPTGSTSEVPDQATSSPEAQQLPWRKRIARWAMRFTPTSILWHLLDYARMLRKTRSILQTERVAALGLIGDRHVGWETAFIKRANQIQIPSLIIPYSLTSPQGAVAHRQTLNDYHLYPVNTEFRRFVARRYPAWVRQEDEIKLFFLPLGNALTAQFCGMMPKNPWSLGGGQATRMTVESPHIEAMLLEQGVPQAKMLITGRASVDQIYATVESVDPAQVRQEMNISAEKPIVLCAVPQLGEHGLLPWDMHWAETEFLFETFASQDAAAVVLSLHPKSDPAAYQPLADQYGALIAQRRAFELIPVCDVFVATFSGTVMAAIGCGIPTVVVDFYELDYNYFDDEPGMVIVKQHADLKPVLQRLLTDRSYHDQLSAAQRQRASQWILLDGKCTRRIADEIYRLCEISPVISAKGL